MIDKAEDADGDSFKATPKPSRGSRFSARVSRMSSGGAAGSGVRFSASRLSSRLSSTGAFEGSGIRRVSLRLSLTRSSKAVDHGAWAGRKSVQPVLDPAMQAQSDHMLAAFSSIFGGYRLSPQDCPPLPSFMRVEEGFGCLSGDKVRLLSRHEFAKWVQRVEQWVEDAKLLQGTDRKAKAFDLEGIDATRLCELIARECPLLETVILRNCKINDNALQSIARSTNKQLRTLDLHGTDGFGDLGLKALAFYCDGLEELRVGGVRASRLADAGPAVRLCPVGTSARSPPSHPTGLSSHTRHPAAPAVQGERRGDGKGCQVLSEVEPRRDKPFLFDHRSEPLSSE